MLSNQNSNLSAQEIILAHKFFFSELLEMIQNNQIEFTPILPSYLAFIKGMASQPNALSGMKRLLNGHIAKIKNNPLVREKLGNRYFDFVCLDIENNGSFLKGALATLNENLSDFIEQIEDIQKHSNIGKSQTAETIIPTLRTGFSSVESKIARTSVAEDVASQKLYQQQQLGLTINEKIGDQITELFEHCNDVKNINNKFLEQTINDLETDLENLYKLEIDHRQVVENTKEIIAFAHASMHMNDVINKAKNCIKTSKYHDAYSLLKDLIFDLVMLSRRYVEEDETNPDNVSKRFISASIKNYLIYVTGQYGKVLLKVDKPLESYKQFESQRAMMKLSTNTQMNDVEKESSKPYIAQALKAVLKEAMSYYAYRHQIGNLPPDEKIVPKYTEEGENISLDVVDKQIFTSPEETLTYFEDVQKLEQYPIKNAMRFAALYVRSASYQKLAHQMTSDPDFKPTESELRCYLMPRAYRVVPNTETETERLVALCRELNLSEIIIAQLKLSQLIQCYEMALADNNQELLKDLEIKIIMLIQEFNQTMEKKKITYLQRNEHLMLAYGHLNGIDLRCCDLRRVNFEGANLTDANISYANLTGVRFKGTQLVKSVAVGTIFDGADLTEASFRDAILTGAYFREVYAGDFANANLTDATVINAKIDKMKNLKSACVKGIKLFSEEVINSKLRLKLAVTIFCEDMCARIKAATGAAQDELKSIFRELLTESIQTTLLHKSMEEILLITQIVSKVIEENNFEHLISNDVFIDMQNRFFNALDDTALQSFTFVDDFFLFPETVLNYFNVLTILYPTRAWRDDFIHYLANCEYYLDLKSRSSNAEHLSQQELICYLLPLLHNHTAQFTIDDIKHLIDVSIQKSLDATIINQLKLVVYAKQYEVMTKQDNIVAAMTLSKKMSKLLNDSALLIEKHKRQKYPPFYVYPNLSHADLPAIHLEGDLSKINLRGANLKGACLPSANLTSAKLDEAVLVSANLQGANLENASTAATNFREANLQNANLSSISGGQFTRANLTNAKLFYANLVAITLKTKQVSGIELFSREIINESLCNVNESLNKDRACEPIYNDFVQTLNEEIEDHEDKDLLYQILFNNITHFIADMPRETGLVFVQSAIDYFTEKEEIEADFADDDENMELEQKQYPIDENHSMTLFAPKRRFIILQQLNQLSEQIRETMMEEEKSLNFHRQND